LNVFSGSSLILVFSQLVFILAIDLYQKGFLLGIREIIMDKSGGFYNSSEKSIKFLVNCYETIKKSEEVSV